MRLKYALPIAQMALSVVLLRASFLWNATGHLADGPHPAFLLLIRLHLPLMLVVKPLMFGDIPALAVLVLAIGAFWYCVVLLLYRRNEHGTPFPTDWFSLRIVADVALIGAVAYLGWLFAENIRDYPLMYALPRSFEEWLWFLPTHCSSLMWILGPIFVFGIDLFRCFGRSSQLMASMSKE
jgi:hypothetical protein